MSNHNLFTPSADGAAVPASSKAIVIAARQVLAHLVRRGASLQSPQKTGEYLMARLGHLDYEVFGLILLDKRHTVIECIDLFRGTIDGAVHPREVVKLALLKSAAAKRTRARDCLGRPLRLAIVSRSFLKGPTTPGWLRVTLNTGHRDPSRLTKELGIGFVLEDPHMGYFEKRLSAAHTDSRSRTGRPAGGGAAFMGWGFQPGSGRTRIAISCHPSTCCIEFSQRQVVKNEEETLHCENFQCERRCIGPVRRNGATFRRA